MGESGKQYLAPVVEMASCTSVAIQVEAANALQVAAESDPAAVARMCGGAGATSAFQKLLTADDIRVVYPIARALSSLALSSQAVEDIFLARETTPTESLERPARELPNNTFPEQQASQLHLGSLPLAPLVALLVAMSVLDTTGKIVKMHLDLTLRRAAKTWAGQPLSDLKHSGAAHFCPASCYVQSARG